MGCLCKFKIWKAFHHIHCCAAWNNVITDYCAEFMVLINNRVYIYKLPPLSQITLFQTCTHVHYQLLSNLKYKPHQSQYLNVSGLVLQLSLPNPLKPGVSQEWRCSWSRTDRWCSNCIWVINNFIAYKGVTHIKRFDGSYICILDDYTLCN